LASDISIVYVFDLIFKETAIMKNGSRKRMKLSENRKQNDDYAVFYKKDGENRLIWRVWEN